MNDWLAQAKKRLNKERRGGGFLSATAFTGMSGRDGG